MNFVENQICARVKNLIGLPSAVLKGAQSAQDTVAGIAGTTLAVATLGYSKELSGSAENLGSISRSLPVIIEQAISVLNPNFKIDYSSRQRSGVLTRGLISYSIKQHFDKKTN